MQFKQKPWGDKPEPKPFFKIPSSKPLSFRTGAYMYGGIVIVGLGMGAAIGTYIFTGVITLAGLIAIVESNKFLKYIVLKGNKALDILIFSATIIATLSLGVTIAMSLTFAGLGYTLVYAPWIRQAAKNNNN